MDVERDLTEPFLNIIVQAEVKLRRHFEFSPGNIKAKKMHTEFYKCILIHSGRAL